jgi:hypothetical protein
MSLFILIVILFQNLDTNDLFFNNGNNVSKQFIISKLVFQNNFRNLINYKS